VLILETKVKHLNTIAALALCAGLAGCSIAPSSSGAQGSRYTYRSAHTPGQAAACFAHNAEEHSSALVAEVQSEADWARALVHVRNGVFYASAEFRRSAGGATGTILLNVTTSGDRADLFRELVEGC
jgi:hypothetical protein